MSPLNRHSKLPRYCLNWNNFPHSHPLGRNTASHNWENTVVEVVHLYNPTNYYTHPNTQNTLLPTV